MKVSLATLPTMVGDDGSPTYTTDSALFFLPVTYAYGQLNAMPVA